MAEPDTALSKESTHKHRDLTQGSIVKNLLQLSWPMIVMEATYMVSQIWDMYWVGKSGGSSSIAAIGIANLIMMLLSTIDMTLIAGARAMIARFIGAKDFESAKKVAGQTYLMAIIWGLIVTLFGSMFIRNVLGIFGMEQAVIEEAVKFLRVFFLGWISLELLIMSLYIIQSTGDSFIPMLIEIFMRVVHVIFCPLLVLGIGFPAMGISGAALANIIGQTVGAVTGLVILFKGYTRMKLSLKDFRFNASMMWREIKIGFWSMLQMLQFNISMLVVTKILVPFGTQALAADRIVGNIQGFIITPNIGLGGGVAVLVGQNLGAKQPDRAKKSTILGASILTGFLLVCGIAVLIFAPNLISFFDKDPQVIAIGAGFLRIATLGYLVMGMNTALQNCIAGAGDTLPNMLISVGIIWLVQIPLTYWLADHTGLGVNGIRWALVISTFVSSIAYLLYYQSGRWKHKKV
jgi:putative MATE family efflux protein